jgi:Family of unknown function (DUF5684)
VSLGVITSLASSSAGLGVFFVFYIAVIVLILAGLWKMYAKAGEHGWAAIIPFYNYWCLLRIVGRPGWWLILYFIPIVNFIIGLVVLWDLAKSFGKSAGWFWGLFLLPFIFFPMLGFGASQYAGPAGPEPWSRPAPAAA